MDWLPTLAAAAGVPDVKEKLLTGYKAGNTNFKVHIDGVNQLDHILGNAPSPRQEFFYFNDDGSLCALRHDRYKLHFQMQRAQGLGARLRRPSASPYQTGASMLRR